VGDFLIGHTDRVNAVAVGALPDGTPVVVTGSDADMVRVWRLTDGAPVGDSLTGHTGHTGPVAAVALGALADGSPVVVSGSGDGTLRVWRLDDGTPVGRPLRLPAWVAGVAVHHNVVITATDTDIAAHQINP
jgi:WD40 repeat protein